MENYTLLIKEEKKEEVFNLEQSSNIEKNNNRDQNLDSDWLSILELLSKKLKTPSINTWLKPAKLVNLSNDFVTIAVKNEFSRNFIHQSYKDHLQKAFKEHYAVSLGLQIIVDENIETSTEVQTEQVPEDLNSENLVQSSLASLQNKKKKLVNSKLQTKYSFENFIVSNFNNAAFTFSNAILDKASGLYKSLFITADTGLGKTHLLHAIGNKARTEDASQRVKYVNAETFTNNLMIAIQRGQTLEFRNKYRNLDLLLFDDFNFLDNKKACQEEFCYTYEAIINNGGAVIICSNTELNSFRKLAGKLQSRISGSLKANLLAPDFTARVKILEEMRYKHKLDLSESQMTHLARKFDANIRELEGAISQLTAYKNYSVEEIDDSLVANLFGAFDTNVKFRGLSIELIIKTTADYFELEEAQLIGKRRIADYTKARHIAIYLAHELLEISYNRIGQAFSNRKHSSIIHSIKTIEKSINSKLPGDKFTQNAIQDIKSKII